jgi:hypothetical protein
MALIPSGYVDPGVYVGEVVQPGSVAITSERVLCIVAKAPRTRRTTDEVVIRGKVFDEALTSWTLVSGSYETELSNVSNRDRNNAILYKNNNAVAIGSWGFKSSYLRGKAVASATFDASVKHQFTLSMDGKAVKTIDVSGGTPASTTVTEVAAAINAALLADTTNYGTAYSSVATTITTTVSNDTLVLTSPITTSASNIRLFFSFEDSGTDEDCADELFASGAELGMVAPPTSSTAVDAPSIVQLATAEYSATASYEIEYVTTETQTDPLTNAATGTPLDSIKSIGSFPGGSNYVINSDYEVNGNLVDWFISGTTTQSSLTGVNGTFNVTASDNSLKIGINGIDPVDVTLTIGAAQTATAVAADINAALNSSSNYGPAYAYVASVSGSAVKLDVPDTLEVFTQARGSESTITLYAPTSNDGSTLIFGIASTSLPYTVTGTGSRPDFGTVYYATYNYTRPSTDYDLPTRVYNPTDLYNFTSPLSSTNYTVNDMAVAGELAFENGATSLFLQLIDDSTAPGTPTLNQIKAAIDKCAEKSDITDVVVVNATANEDEVSAYLMSHVSTESSYLNKNYRRGWYGMARSTDPGDQDTPDTFVYRATRTLQPGGTSSGRGRQILCAPSDISRTLTLEDSTEVDYDLDSTYLATAIAGYFTSLPNVSDAMVRAQIVGFNASDFEEYAKAERANLASNGVLVATLDAGVIRLLDPITTEAGGSGVVHFEEPQGSAMKDSVTRAVETVLNSNVVGVVPSDLTDFISDIKTWIAIAIRSKINDGSIGPYRDSSNVVRDIDLVSDVKVFQSSTDPRTFTFQYWYNLKYPGKRFFGEYSVDNPFFNA